MILLYISIYIKLTVRLFIIIVLSVGVYLVNRLIIITESKFLKLYRFYFGEFISILYKYYPFISI